MRINRTSRGSGIGVFNRGATAAVCSRSTCIRRDTAVARAWSADSRTVIRPSGLSSRTTSPVSVIHDEVRSPANSISTRNAGSGAPAPRTSSRRPTSTLTFELRSVAGSNTVH
jgi:hypothetical protein